LRDADFWILIGALVVHFHMKKQGRLCSRCVHKAFWGCSLVTLLLGWWSIPSLILTPVVLVLNLVSYVVTFRLPPYPVDPPAVPLGVAAVEKLRLCRDEIFQRLLKGEALAQVAEDIAGRVGVSPEQVKAFYNGTWEAVGNEPSYKEADEPSS
jgi:hypothetical protein